MKVISCFFLFFASLSLSFAEESNRGEMYWESIKCGGITADLMVNHRTVAQPTLFMNQTPILLEDGPDYSGPYCVKYQGEIKVGFAQTWGNAAADYSIVDIDTFSIKKISYSVAHKIGFNL